MAAVHDNDGASRAARVRTVHAEATPFDNCVHILRALHQELIPLPPQARVLHNPCTRPCIGWRPRREEADTWRSPRFCALPPPLQHSAFRAIFQRVEQMPPFASRASCRAATLSHSSRSASCRKKHVSLEPFLRIRHTCRTIMRVFDKKIVQITRSRYLSTAVWRKVALSVDDSTTNLVAHAQKLPLVRHPMVASRNPRAAYAYT